MGKKTGPATGVPSSYAARVFGEEAAGNYGVTGRLICINRLPVGDLGLLTLGFRITDRPYEKWTRRFNRFKYGEPTATSAATTAACSRWVYPAAARAPADLVRLPTVETPVAMAQMVVLGRAPMVRLMGVMGQKEYGDGSRSESQGALGDAGCAGGGVVVGSWTPRLRGQFHVMGSRRHPLC